MVVAILSRVILATNVNDGVAGGQKSWVTGSNESGWIVGGKHAEKMDGEGLVGVEMATRDISQEIGNESRADRKYLWVPINGPGSILNLFDSVILKMLRSINVSPRQQ